MFTSTFFREKCKIKVTLNLVLYLFERIQVFLDKIDIVNKCPVKSTHMFLYILIFLHIYVLLAI